MCTALNTAKYILNYCKDNGIRDCSNKKLQKLLYYVQAWSLAFDNGPVFDDEIEAWVHGPVVRSVYRKYKDFGFNPIFVVDNRGYDADCFSDTTRIIMDTVLKTYSKYDAEVLEMRTHLESPWIEARRSGSTVISQDSMRTYYKSMLEKSNASAE